MTNPLATESTERDLGDNLFLRWSTAADKEKLAYFLGMTFRDSADEPFSTEMSDWSDLCMRADFPFSGPEDWAIVEDRGKQDSPIVACTCFWSHEWRYGDIPIGVGRPEFVATDPDYRNRGLIRAIFGLLHERSAAKSQLMQGITGIPYFYRLFGYEYVLDLGGNRVIQVAQLPEKKGDDPEPCTLRFATSDDIPKLMQLYELGQPQSLMWHDAPESFWQLLINTWTEPTNRAQNPFDAALLVRPYMILSADGDIYGSVLVAVRRWDDALRVRNLCLSATTNVAQITSPLLRALKSIGEALPCSKPEIPFRKITLGFGRHHPIYDVLGPTLAPSAGNPYAWYIRVPDVPAFVRHIAPVLEERVANSMLVGHTGELKIDFYRAGLSLRFEAGKLVQVEPWRPALYENGNAGFPPLVFLQLLLGYRSLAELRDIFPDVWANKDATLLLNILFPKLPSVVHPLA